MARPRRPGGWRRTCSPACRPGSHRGKRGRGPTGTKSAAHEPERRAGQGQARYSATRTPDPPTKAPPPSRAGPSVAGWRSARQGTAGPLRSAAGCSAPLVERPTIAPWQLDKAVRGDRRGVRRGSATRDDLGRTLKKNVQGRAARQLVRDAQGCPVRKGRSRPPAGAPAAFVAFALARTAATARCWAGEASGGSPWSSASLAATRADHERRSSVLSRSHRSAPFLVTTRSLGKAGPSSARPPLPGCAAPPARTGVSIRSWGRRPTRGNDRRLTAPPSLP